MEKNNNWCTNQGGLKNFSVKAEFPDLVQYFNFNEKVWMTACKVASFIIALESESKNQKENEDSFLWNGTVVHLTWKSLKTNLAVKNLLEHGFMEDAYILLRSVLESVITLKYISLDVSSRIRPFHEYSYIFKKRIREANKDVYGQDIDSEGDPAKKKILKRVDNEYQRVRNNYSKKSSWSSVSIFDMAKEVGLEADYRMFYSYFSQYTHTTVNTENRFIKEDVQGFFKIIISPSKEDEEELKTAIHLVTYCTMMMITIFISVFKTEYEKELENLFREFHSLYGIK